MESSTLASALDKIRGGESVPVASLSDEEASALAAFLNAKAADSAMSDADQLLCRHIRVALQERAARTRQAESEQSFQRSNLALRAAIDLFLAQDYVAILQKDVSLLRDTRSRLESLLATDASSPNHIRLCNLIGECLAAFDAWQSSQPAVAHDAQAPTSAESVALSESGAAPGSVGEVPSVPNVVSAREIVSTAGIRESIVDIEGIPLTASVRTLVHEGSLVLDGDLTDEFLLDVRGGTLEVRGAFFGIAVADGDITIRDNVQGGWILSRKGSIRSGRILGGSVAIAPLGSIVSGGAENPRLVFCGGDFSTEQGVRSGVYFARDFSAGEGIRNARIYLRGSLVAKSIYADAQEEGAGIQFRLAQTSNDYGKPIPETVSASLRSFGRLRYRRRIAAGLLAYLETDLLAVQRLRIFAMQSAATDATQVGPIRCAQVERSMLTALLELGEGFKELMVLGENIAPGMDAALVNVGIEESTACLAILAREIKTISRAYVRDRELLEAPCRHIASFAKKTKDTVRLGQGADKLLFDFDFRMDEWRAQVEKAAAELVGFEATMAALLGPNIWTVTEPERLAALLSRLNQSAEEAGKMPRLMQAREMMALRELVQQHQSSRTPWRENAETLRQEYEQARKTLEESIGLAVAEDGEKMIRTEDFGPGVRIQTLASIKKVSGANGAMVLVTGGQAGAPGLVRMRNLRLYPEENNA